jgi:hypothetical protein
MAKHLNKKLQAAIDERKPLRWEFGDYAKYYTGMKLVAYSGYTETGHIFESIVFATVSLDGAEKLQATLDSMKVETSGFLKAALDHEKHQASWRRPIVE